MGRGTILNHTEKKQALAHRRENRSLRFIAKAIRRSVGAVRNLLSGRPRATLGRPRVYSRRTRGAFAGHVKRSVKKARGR